MASETTSLVRAKVLKSKDTPLSSLEVKMAEAYVDLEAHSKDFQADMKSLKFYTADEFETSSGRKAILVTVPVPQLKSYKKIGHRLVRELEKKFSDKHVVFVSRRKIVAKPKRQTHVHVVRPRSRTLTAVHENLLLDIVSPTEIIGKRVRVKRDGSRVIKAILDPKEKNTVEYKLDTWASVYHKLTGKTVAFEFSHHATD